MAYYGSVMGGGAELFTGYYSTIRQSADQQGVELIHKSYGEKSGSLTYEASEWLQQMMNRFDEIAENIGVPTARPLVFQTLPNGKPGHVTLVETVSYVGPDVQRLLDCDDLDETQRLTLLQGVLTLNKRVADAGYPITLDTVFANYCLGTEGLVYIDKMPPRQRLSDGRYLSEIPDPPATSRAVVERRHFSPVQHQVIYVQGLRALTGERNRALVPRFKQAIGAIMGDEAYAMIDIDEAERQRLRKEPTSLDIDALRILAWEGYHDGQLSLDEAKRAHSLAHIHYGGILPTPAELQEVAAIIRADHGVIFQT